MDMLGNEVKEKAMKGTMTGFIIGLVIAIVVLFALLPAVNTGISDAGLEGVNASIASLVVTLLILVPVAAIGATLA
jgi:hypothetical protein